MAPADDPDTAQLLTTLAAWKAAERWAAALSRYFATVDVPALVRVLELRGVSRKAIGEAMAEPGGPPLSVPRVDQIAKPFRQLDPATGMPTGVTAPSWWTGHLSDRPPAGYNPIAEVVAVAPCPIPLPGG